MFIDHTTNSENIINFLQKYKICYKKFYYGSWYAYELGLCSNFNQKLIWND